MSIPRKHAALIHAWADGAEIQARSVGSVTGTEYWSTLEEPNWASSIQYRIKPHRWQAEIDAQKVGKAVQWRVIGEATWREEHKGLLIADDACEYQIKPETIRYRVAIFQHAGTLPYTMTVDNGHQETKAPECIGFVKWLGDWQEVEA